MSQFQTLDLDLKLAEAEALAEIAKRPKNTRVYIRVWVRIELPIQDSPGRIFPGLALLNIDRLQAAMLIKDILGTTLEDRGGRIPMKIEQTSDTVLGNSRWITIG